MCSKSFPTPGDLKSHTYVHTGTWPFKCHVCHRGFSKQTNLKNHLLLHSGRHANRSIDLTSFDREKGGRLHRSLLFRGHAVQQQLNLHNERARERSGGAIFAPFNAPPKERYTLLDKEPYFHHGFDASSSKSNNSPINRQQVACLAACPL